jgi:hypothetical protein
MKEQLPESWDEARRAMKDVIASYQTFIYNVTELCDLLGWRYDYMFSRLIPCKKWERSKTTHFKEVFASLEDEMIEAMFATDKRRKANEKKRELMEKFNLTEEDIDAMIESLAN